MAKPPLSMKPTGWFQVAWSDEIGIGDVHRMTYFGEEMVAWRAQSGRLTVMNAYCEHLGAHLGYGGQVHGEVLQCPFHGWQWDAEGRKYLDALAGIGVSCLGHAHPALVAAIAGQAARLIHTSNIYEIPQQTALAARLAELSGMQEVAFNNSGSEANEAAIKLARYYAYQRGNSHAHIITMDSSWHGRTLGTLVQSGVPILEALNIVRDTAGNAVFERAFTRIYESIREGETIAQPLREARIVDDIVVNMIDVGEETGELDKMLIKVADNYDDEVDVEVSSLVSVIEPILILFMGGAVFVISDEGRQRLSWAVIGPETTGVDLNGSAQLELNYDAFRNMGFEGVSWDSRRNLLFIAQEIVTAHGGTIKVTSSAASGTTFRVRLPLHSGAAAVD